LPGSGVNDAVMAITEEGVYGNKPEEGREKADWGLPSKPY